MVQVPPYESSVCDKMDGLFPPLGGERPVKRHIKKKLGGGQVEKEQLKSSGGPVLLPLVIHPIIPPPAHEHIRAQMREDELHAVVSAHMLARRKTTYNEAKSM